MINDIFPARPFFERYECIGTLRNGDYAAENLHVIIEYPLHTQGEVVGHVLGRTDTFNKIAWLTRSQAAEFEFLSVADDDCPIEISSKSVRLLHLRNRQIITDRRGSSTTVIAELAFDDLTYRYFLKQPRTPSKPCRLTYFLVGPQTIWSAAESPEWFQQEESDSAARDDLVHFDVALPFQIKASLRRLHSEIPTSEGYQVSTLVMTICLTPDMTMGFSDIGLLEEAESVVNDLLLLSSLASRAWIVWHRRELESSTCLEETVARARDASSAHVDSRHTLLDPINSRSFFQTALGRLRDLRAKDFDLFMPIAYYVSGNVAIHAEEQFAAFFLALERLKDMYSRSTGTMEAILGKDQFSQLRQAIQETIDRVVVDTEKKDLIFKKVAELNRPAFRSVLEDMMRTYEIGWQDLYPAGADLTFVKTRNSLFHTSSELDPLFFIKELHRLKAVLERFLLTFLGWKDFSRSPAEWERNRLKEME